MNRSAATTRVSVVYYSHYRGATEAVARAISRGAASVPGTEVALISVEAVERNWERLHDSDAVIFGSPTYIGGPAARFKLFIEQLAGEVWVKRLWTNKIAAGFTVSAGRSGDKLACLEQMVMYASQLGMIWVPMRITGGNYSTKGSEQDLNRMAGYLGVMAQANIDEPPELAPPPADILTAELHGEHVATVTRQYAYGRRAFPAAYDPWATAAARTDAAIPATLYDLIPKP